MEQVHSLLSSCKGNTIIEKRNFAIINTLAFLGLRRIEITKLDMADISRHDGVYFMRIQGKGHSEKDAQLRITEDILKPIEDYWSLRPDNFNKNTPAFITYTRSGSERITPPFVSKMVKKHLRKIGLDDRMYCCHSLRHGAAILSMEAGSTVAQVQQMLRQKNISVTEQYLKQLRQRQSNDNTAISNLGQLYQKYKDSHEKQDQSI